jgi:hypothetical protein
MAEKRLRTWLTKGIAYWLPARVVYWAAIRVFATYTCDNEDVCATDARCYEAMSHWFDARVERVVKKPYNLAERSLFGLGAPWIVADSVTDEQLKRMEGQIFEALSDAFRECPGIKLRDDSRKPKESATEISCPRNESGCKDGDVSMFDIED